MSPLIPQEVIFRLLELGPEAVLRVGGTGNGIVIYVLDGESERRIELQIVSDDFTPTTPPPPSPTAPPPDLSERSARELGLPLYLSREWMLGQLVRHKTIEGVSAESGYSLETLRAYRVAHAISSATEEVIRSEWATGKYRTQNDLADTLGISKARVSRIVGDARNVEIDARIRELIDAGLGNNDIADIVTHEGSRKTRERLIDLIRKTRLRSRPESDPEE